MPPSGLAILLGAGPATGAGIARILSHPNQGNLAIALLARRPEPLNDLVQNLRQQNPGAIIEGFSSDTSPQNLQTTFQKIKSHKQFEGLKLKVAIFNVKNSSKKPFLEESYGEFMRPMEEYVGGAMVFAQESIKRFMEENPGEGVGEKEKKGTLIFTGTLGALRCNAEFASYGASRSSVRQLAQALAREYSAKGIHVVHTIANGRITDADNEETRSGKHMSAEAVGKTYLWLAGQEMTLWTHELDLRPAQEKF